MAIIGLDFGNFNCYVAFVQGYDDADRLRGRTHSLLPASFEHGIPSIYFYSKNTGPLLCDKALRTIAIPYDNRLRYLKKHLDETIDLDGKTINYNDAITEVIQYCVRAANKELQNNFAITTNEICLSHPAFSNTFSYVKYRRLVELAERATLEDGTHVKVVKTIAEPAAACLDYLAYLAEHRNVNRDITVLAYDLGGGTFDLSLVSLYPNGRRNNEGETFFYDIHLTNGDENIGGTNFDEVVYELLIKNASQTLTSAQKNQIRFNAELVKCELSENDKATCAIMRPNGTYLNIEVTKEEFESASANLIDKTVKMTKAMINDNWNLRPEMIILTGGASQMPMVKKSLEKALPQYKGRIQIYRPDRAIAFGAARFGGVQRDPNPRTNPNPVQKRVPFDIGILMYQRPISEDKQIVTHIKAGTPLPVEGNIYQGSTRKESSSSAMNVYEAKKIDPNELEWDRDYNMILKASIDHGGIVPAETPIENRIKIDADGKLTVEGRVSTNEINNWTVATVQLQNIITK